MKSGLGPDTALALTDKKAAANPTPVQHAEYSQASRALALGSYFVSGVMAINASQFLGAPLYLINKEWYNAWIAFTKQSFGLLTTTMTQFWAPTVMRISGDRSMRGQLMKTVDGNLLCNFPHRLVLIANHQIYTDWLYLWWIAYTNGMHGRLYIILKESLRRIPVIGWGMQLSQFIFMKRNWEKDKPNMTKHLKKLNSSSKPMWLLLFPEGTNLAPSTRKSSKKWAEKNGISDMQHQLLPRSTGLQFCLQELRSTVEYLYDCTIAYEGVRRGQYAQDVFTLKASYLEGRPPKSVSMYWRRFKLASIPLDDAKAFEEWLRVHWTSKDMLLEGYLRTGKFPADTGVENLTNGTTRRGAGYIETQIKSVKWYEFMQIFAPIGLFGLVLYAFYGALPKHFVKSINKKTIQKKVEMVQKVVAAGPAAVLQQSTNILNGKKLPIQPLVKMLVDRKLPVVTILQGLSERNLLIGQFPAGLLFKLLTQTSLSVPAMQSLLRMLSDKGLLKGSISGALPPLQPQPVKVASRTQQLLMKSNAKQTAVEQRGAVTIKATTTTPSTSTLKTKPVTAKKPSSKLSNSTSSRTLAPPAARPTSKPAPIVKTKIAQTKAPTKALPSTAPKATTSRTKPGQTTMSPSTSKPSNSKPSPVLKTTPAIKPALTKPVPTTPTKQNSTAIPSKPPSAASNNPTGPPPGPQQAKKLPLAPIQSPNPKANGTTAAKPKAPKLRQPVPKQPPPKQPVARAATAASVVKRSPAAVATVKADGGKALPPGGTANTLPKLAVKSTSTK